RVDRIQAKAQGVRLDDLFGSLQMYLGSQYINDFNLFGRTYRVMAQADASYRDDPSDLDHLYTRNADNQMVPLTTMVQLRDSFGPAWSRNADSKVVPLNRWVQPRDAVGPAPVIRYNASPAADLIGQSDAALLSSGQTLDAVVQIADQVLPAGMTLEWTDLSFQN